MIFYRLALERIIQYLHLDELFKENENRLMLLHRQPKETYRTRLRMNRTMNLCVSTLLSVISLLVCITIPYAALESPCEELKKHHIYLYSLAKWIEKYIGMIDRIIMVLMVVLVGITGKTLWDGIKSTNISMSPWLERGKYVLPGKTTKSSLPLFT